MADEPANHAVSRGRSCESPTEGHTQWWRPSNYPTCITTLPNKRACVDTMLKACWETNKTHSCSHTSVVHLGVRRPAVHCDWTAPHSSTRCVRDRPGSGRWRRKRTGSGDTAEHMTRPPEENRSHPKNEVQEGKHVVWGHHASHSGHGVLSLHLLLVQVKPTDIQPTEHFLVLELAARSWLAGCVLCLSNSQTDRLHEDSGTS